MAETWEVELGDNIYEVEADTLPQAMGKARLLDARERSVARATAGPRAEAEALARRDPGYDAAYPRLPLGVALDPTTPEGQANNAMLTGASVAASGGIVPFLKAAGMSALGAWGGGKIGGEVGEWVGEPGIGRTVGAAVGGIAAPVAGPGVVRDLATGGKVGILKALLGKGPESLESAAARAAHAAKRAELEVAKLAEKKASREAIAAARERSAKIAEERNAILRLREEARAAGKEIPKAGPRLVPPPSAAPRTEGATALKPEPEFIPDEAVSLVAEPLPFKPRGTTMATNLGGKAKPGPAPTPPDEIEAKLRESLTKIQGEKGSPLQVPRIEVGAQKVGRQVGMTKEQVRQEAGPVLDETRGEASPILPKKALSSIIDTMKALPMAEREAYVARATSGKAKWQIENIRRTLEHLGLLIPVGGLTLGQILEERQ